MSADTWRTFRLHLEWGAAIAVPLVASIWLGHTLLMMRVRSVLAVLVCTLPALMWRVERRSSEIADVAEAGAPETELSTA